MALFRRVKPPFSLKTLVKDSNCVLIQDPSAIWGGADHLPRRNLLLATDTLATQNVTVTAEIHTLYIQGTGSVTLSGTGSGTLSGTGANDRVTLVFTPTAGTLTLTVSGTVTFGMLCKSSVLDRSYQKITDWTTEQYAHAATKNVPWLRRNILGYTTDFSTGWVKGSITTGQSDYSGGTSACLVTTNSSGQLYFNPGANLAQATYSFSVVVKKTDSGTRYVMVGLGRSGGGDECTLFVDLTNGAMTSQTGCDSYSIADLGGGFYRLSVTKATATALVRYIEVFGSTDGSTVNAAATTFIAIEPIMVVGPVSTYQRIATTWPAEYTAIALAAGYPISLYSDRAGTTATYGPDDPVGKLLDLSGDNNHATAPGDAQRPVLTLDGNGRYYLERDPTDDNLPITWPTNLTTTGVQYVADQTTTTETTGITLNGATSYTTPQRPTGDYGRIIFKAPAPNSAKVKKYLDKKAGR
jgi:hypothetical protein